MWQVIVGLSHVTSVFVGGAGGCSLILPMETSSASEPAVAGYGAFTIRLTVNGTFILNSLSTVSLWFPLSSETPPSCAPH